MEKIKNLRQKKKEVVNIKLDNVCDTDKRMQRFRDRQEDRDSETEEHRERGED